MQTGTFFIFQLIIFIGLSSNKALHNNYLKVITIGVLQLISVFLFQNDIDTNNKFYYVFGIGYISYGIYLKFCNKKKGLHES